MQTGQRADAQEAQPALGTVPANSRDRLGANGQQSDQRVADVLLDAGHGQRRILGGVNGEGALPLDGWWLALGPDASAVSDCEAGRRATSISRQGGRHSGWC